MTQNNSPQTSFVGTASPVFIPIHVGTDHMAGYAVHPFIVYLNNQPVVEVRNTAQGVTASDRISRLERNPKRKAALERARGRIGQWLTTEEVPGSSIAALRLRAGLSQRELAQRMNTHQSNISRLEKQPDDPKLSTLEALAAALSVPLTSVIDAVKQHQETIHEGSAP